MTYKPNLWETGPQRGDLTLELHAGDDPALEPAQRENRLRVELAHVKPLVAALADAPGDLAEVLASGGVYHA